MLALQAKIGARDTQLQEMIEAARVRPERSWRARTRPLMRIDLREASVLRSTGGTLPSRSSTPSHGSQSGEQPHWIPCTDAWEHGFVRSSRPVLAELPPACCQQISTAMC